MSSTNVAQTSQTAAQDALNVDLSSIPDVYFVSAVADQEYGVDGSLLEVMRVYFGTTRGPGTLSVSVPFVIYWQEEVLISIPIKMITVNAIYDGAASFAAAV